jgi:alkanesulfonate monooxygenase SsuD/methylene tetrahydromethanopterin reductase-like flavin-dependent oxidoreductase (luciferase family)
MATATRSATLALWVANTSLRHPLHLASQVSIAHGLSGGRVELGLGAGSYALARHDHSALGLSFPPLAQRLRRLDLSCRALPQLWRGETVSCPELGLHGASLGALEIEPPPLLVGGRSPAALDIAARWATYWNLEDGDADSYLSLARQARDAAGRVGRSAAFPGTAQLFTDGKDPAALADEVAAFRDAGVHTLMLIMDDPDVSRVPVLGKAVHRG